MEVLFKSESKGETALFSLKQKQMFSWPEIQLEPISQRPNGRKTLHHFMMVEDHPMAKENCETPFSDMQRPGMLEDAQKWLPATPSSKKNTCKGENEHTVISTNEFVDHEPNLKKYLDTERHRWALLGIF